MDELAQRYLLLGLRLDRIAPGFVDSYVGPPELAEIARAEPMPLAAELHAESLALRELVESSEGQTDGQTSDDGLEPLGEHRRAWFLGQLRAMSALARRAGGEQIEYLDLVEELFGIPIRLVPDNDLALVRDRIDSALPGRGSLHQRLADFRATLRVASDVALPAVEASAARFRSATRRDFQLPSHESIDWQPAHDEPWGAHAGFLGDGRTLIRINLDLPSEVTLIAFLASHEAYPGHHAEHVAKEQALIRSAGLGEATLHTMNTPEAVLAEGQADVAREVVMTDAECADELRRIGEMAGVHADWSAAVAVRGALNEMQGAMANAGILLYHDGRPEQEIREYLTDVGTTAPERLDHAMRVLRDPVNSTYTFTYTEGARLIRRWLEVQGQTAGFQRLLSEQLSPTVLIADLAAASVPVGDSA